MKKLTALTLSLLCVTSIAGVKLPSIISDNMVLQQNTQVKLWGWANKGEKVNITASWGGNASTTADSKGNWKLAIKTPVASDKTYTITINDKTIKNVVTGEVWLGSGQSNMALGTVHVYKRYKQEFDKANYPMVRQFCAENRGAPTPADNTPGKWVICKTPLKGWSAVGYFFSTALNKDLNVPVGFINSSVGGSMCEAWMSMDTAKKFPNIMNKKAIKELDKQVADYNEEESQKLLADVKKNFDKYARKFVAWEKGDRKGKRPLNPWGASTSLLHPHARVNYPAGLYNAMIYPIRNYTIKGLLWYQGEGNVWDTNYDKLLSAMVIQWSELWGQGNFPAIFVQLPRFQKAWKVPEEGHGAAWVRMRDLYAKAAKNTPNAYYTVNIDTGDAKNIHPTDKKPVGERLELMALKKVYKKDGKAWGGPVVKDVEFKGHKAVVKYDTQGADLAVKDNAELFGFAVYSNNKKAVRAKAKIISKDSVEVTAPNIKEITAVMYARANNPEGINLINKAGMPAESFKKVNNITPLKPAKPSDTGLIKNGKFEVGAEHWIPWKHSKLGNYKLSVKSCKINGKDENAAVFAMDKAGDGHNWLQLIQYLPEFEHGAEYTLSFKARMAKGEPTKITTIIRKQKGNKAPMPGCVWTKKIEKDWTNVNVTFKATKMDSLPFLTVGLGQVVGTICLADFKLIKK